jgi:hypothetical protein
LKGPIQIDNSKNLDWGLKTWSKQFGFLIYGTNNYLYGGLKVDFNNCSK